jgi:uncharacterized protein (TIGR00725 family)
MKSKDSSPIRVVISGAADTGHCTIDALEQAKALGMEIARHHGILMTGVVTGFPLWSAKGASEAGGTIIGFSPAANEHEHTKVYRLPVDYVDVPIYTGFGYMGRDLLMVRSADAVIFGCGRVGTIHEFTVAYEEQKVIGILQGDWKTDKILKDIAAEDAKKDKVLIFDTDPRRLVDQVMKRVKEKRMEDVQK